MSDPLSVAFAFAMFQQVKIVPLGLRGRINARCERPGGQLSYLLVWWSDGKRSDEWLHESELAAT